MLAEAVQRDSQPLTLDFRRRQRLGRSSVLTNKLAHYSSCVRMPSSDIACLDDEAEVAEPRFNVIQSAITARIRIDFTGARRDFRVAKVSLESDHRRATRKRRRPGNPFAHTCQTSCPAGCIDDHACAK